MDSVNTTAAVSTGGVSWTGIHLPVLNHFPHSKITLPTPKNYQAQQTLFIRNWWKNEWHYLFNEWWLLRWSYACKRFIYFFWWKAAFGRLRIEGFDFKAIMGNEILFHKWKKKLFLLALIRCEKSWWSC